MKLSKLFFTVVGLLGFLGSGLAQNTQTNKTHGILGYLDPKTGIFRSLTREARSASDPSITPTTGTFSYTITITVSSTAPKGPITCNVTATVDDPKEGTFSNEVSAPASVVGNTATCKITIPYEWYLDTPSADKVYLDLYVSTYTSSTKGSYDELFYAPLLTLSAVPANGSTTTETYTTTI